ncbi:MAG: hypothetical protein WC785_00640 [Tatlockia sp.]
MDKRYLTPFEMSQIASQHAACAHYLLQDNAEISLNGKDVVDTLTSFVSLMYLAFELTFKAYLLNQYNNNSHHKNLVELLEQCAELDLPAKDVQLIKKLSRQCSFRKGTDHEMWEDRQHLHVFCSEIVVLYERIQEVMPLELQKDYQ